MTAALGAELWVSILPSLQGLQEKFGAAGSLAGAAMGTLAGEQLGKAMSRHAQKAGGEAGGEAAKAFGEQFGAGLKGGQALAEVAGAAGDAFKGLGGKMAADLMGEFNKAVSGQVLNVADIVKPFEQMENAITAPIMGTIGKIPLLGGALREAKSWFDTFTAAGADYMQTLIDIGDTYQQVARRISESTIDTEQIQNLTNSVRDIMASGAIVHMDDVSSAIGRLNENIKGLTGEQLKALTTNFAEAEEVVGRIDPTKFAGVLNAWGVGADGANEMLTKLVNTSRETGLGINQMLNEMQQAGPAFRALGYSAEQTAQFFATMQKAGDTAGRSVYAFTEVYKRFVKEGVDPKEGMKNLITAIKEFATSGDMDEASKLAFENFGQRGGAYILDAIRKNLLDIPQLMAGLQGIDTPIHEAVEQTQSLSDAFEKVGHQIQAALEPVGKFLAQGLIGASDSISKWLKENEGKIIQWGTNIAAGIMHAVQEVTRMIGDALVAFAGFVNPLKEMVVIAIDAMMAPVKNFVDLMSHLPFIGHLFEGAKTAFQDTANMLDKIDNIDLGHIADQWGHAIQGVADRDIPQVIDKIKGVGQGMQDNVALTHAMAESVNGELKPAFDQLKDAQGKMLGGTAEAPANLQLLGGPDQWRDVTSKLQQLGVFIETNTAGVISKISFANQKAHDEWTKWYEENTRKPGEVAVEVKPQKDGKEIKDSGDLVPPGQTTVGVAGTGAAGQPLPKGVGGYTAGGIPITSYEVATGGAPGAAPSALAAVPPMAGGQNIRAYLTQALSAAGMTPDEIHLALALNQAEGGEAHPESVLGFTESQAQGVPAHVQAFLKQWQTRMQPRIGKEDIGISPTGQVTDINKAINAVREMVGQQGVSSDWQGAAQPSIQKYNQMLAQGWQATAGGVAGGVAPPMMPTVGAPPGTQSSPIFVAPAPGTVPAAGGALPQLQAAMPGVQWPTPGVSGPTFAVPGFTPQAGVTTTVPAAPTGVEGPAPRPTWRESGDWKYYKDPHGFSWWVPPGQAAPSIPEDGKFTETGPWRPVVDPNGNTVGVYVGDTKPVSLADLPAVPQAPPEPEVKTAGAPPAPPTPPAGKWNFVTGDGGTWKHFKTLDGLNLWVRPGDDGPATPDMAAAGGQFVPTTAPDGKLAYVWAKSGAGWTQQPRIGPPTGPRPSVPTPPSEPVQAPAPPKPPGAGISIPASMFDPSHPPALPPGATAWVRSGDNYVPSYQFGVSTPFTQYLAGQGVTGEPAPPPGFGKLPVSAKDVPGAQQAIAAVQALPGYWGTAAPIPAGIAQPPVATAPPSGWKPPPSKPTWGDVINTRSDKSLWDQLWDAAFHNEGGPVGFQDGGAAMSPEVQEHWLWKHIEKHYPGEYGSWENAFGGKAKGFQTGGPGDPWSGPHHVETDEDLQRIFKILKQSAGDQTPIVIPGIEGHERDVIQFPGGHYQFGGDVPWLPGSMWGKDSILAALSPNEHVVTSDEVNAAGGHGTVLKLRQMMKQGMFRGLQPGGPVGAQGPGMGATPLNTQGAQVDTIAIGYAVEQAFGITDQGFYRGPDGYNEHASGEAVDVMVGLDNPVGNQVVQFALANAQQFGVQYCLWQQQQWNPDGTRSTMTDRGDATQNHRDHVHIRTMGGGFPPGGGPGAQGYGAPSSGETSNVPAPAAAQLLGTGSIPAGSMAGVGGPMISGQLGAVGAGGPQAAGFYSPYGQMPPGLTPRQQMEFQANYGQWQLGQATAQQNITNAGTSLQKAMAEQAQASSAFTSAQATYQGLIDKAAGDQAKLNAMMPDILKATAAKDEAERKLASANDTLAREQSAYGEAVDRQKIEALKPPPKPPTPEEVKAAPSGEQLGRGLVKGLFQEIGLPDVFGKPFTEWGLWKLGMGGVGYGLGLLNRIGQGEGAGYGGSTPLTPGMQEQGLLQGGVGGILQSIGLLPGKGRLPGIAGTLPTSGMPGAPGLTVGPAAMLSQTPANVPMAVPGVSPGPGLTVNQYNNGIMAPPDIKNTVRTNALSTSASGVSGGAPLDVLH